VCEQLDGAMDGADIHGNIGTSRTLCYGNTVANLC
jgi:hypothetical protein